MAETALANADSWQDDPVPEGAIQPAQDPDTVEKGETEKHRYHKSFIGGGKILEVEEDAAGGKRHHATPENGYPLREADVRLPFTKTRLVFNPFVSLFGLGKHISVKISCMFSFIAKRQCQFLLTSTCTRIFCYICNSIPSLPLGSFDLLHG